MNRIESIKQSIRDSMLRPKKSWHDVGSIDKTKDPLIIRNALAVKKKFTESPLSVWRNQLIPGGVVIEESDIQITGALPDYATDDEKQTASEYGVSVWSIVGHIVPSYPKLLKNGTSGIKEMARKYESNSFYESCVIVLDALEILAQRYVDYCSELADNENDKQRSVELRQMAADLEYVPKNPAATFRQAVTCIWFTHYAFQLTGNSLAIGRFDQHVGEYLTADLEKGIIDMETAQELVTCFFLKFNERSIDNSIPKSHTDFDKANQNNEKNWAKRTPFDHSTQRTNIRDSVDATNHWLQNVIIGGVKPCDGTDASNPVTYMCLEAFDVNRMTNPCLTVRLSDNTPADLYAKSSKTLLNGGGLPAFFNDEAIISALVRWGIPIEDARDYTNDGCWEIILAGKNDFYFDRFNMLRCLEWTLNHGKSRVDDKVEAPDLGDPTKFESYDAVYDAFMKELYYEIEGLVEKNSREFGRRYRIAPVPLLSALLDGPMELGGDMTQVGATYITYGLIGEGVSHVIDSLAAIKKVIFEDEKYSMTDLINALDKNYVGYEEMRAELLNAPKYGRNDKYADEIGSKLLIDFADKVEIENQTRKIKFLPGAGTFSWYIAIGEGCGASPDGRLANEAVSSNFSPSAGAATNGITGAILSHASFDMTNLPVGSPTDLRLSSKLVENDDGMNRLTGLLRTFVKLGGNMLTITIADTELLRRAQKYPEQYRDLRVRMGGWSAYFTMLSEEQQNHHINKEESIS